MNMALVFLLAFVSDDADNHQIYQILKATIPTYTHFRNQSAGILFDVRMI